MSKTKKVIIPLKLAKDLLHIMPNCMYGPRHMPIKAGLREAIKKAEVK